MIQKHASSNLLVEQQGASGALCTLSTGVNPRAEKQPDHA